ncbi:MAG: archaeosortase/exosortase family protein, partial [Rhodoferax sp.]
MKAQLSPAKILLPWLILLAGFGAVFLPTFVDLFRTLWSTDQNAHGPIVLVVAVWFFYFKAKGIAESGELTIKPAKTAGSLTILLGLLMYVAGRSQSVYVLEVGSIVPLLAGCVMVYFGTAICKRLWFAFFFLCFMIPLPGSVVDTLTQPMKIAVSYATEHILYWLGYPIARNGV